MLRKKFMSPAAALVFSGAKPYPASVRGTNRTATGMYCHTPNKVAISECGTSVPTSTARAFGLQSNATTRTEFPLSDSRERLTESKATTLDNKRRKLCRTAFKFGWDAMAPDTSSKVRYLPPAALFDSISPAGTLLS
jgi:hypothetical protein